MKRAALIALCLLAGIAGAKAPAPVSLPPCVAIDELRLTNVVKGSPQIFYFNIFKARKHLRLKRKERSLVGKLPPPSDPSAVASAKAEAPALRKRIDKTKGPVVRSAKRVGGCKSGRTRNKRGQCGRWK